MRRLALYAIVLAASVTRADGIDRDTLLTDAPAVPNQGTVRITGGVTGTTDSSGAGNTHGQAQISGIIQWTPVENVAGDVGAYYQVGAEGPSARVRYQFLNQLVHGLDLSCGVRFKTVGFHPNQGEVEFLVAAGRRFGKFELVFNGVFGVEMGAGSGKDIEAKGFAGYRFRDEVRAGLDSRLQAEVSDQEGAVKPPGVRDYDLTAGPAGVMARGEERPTAGAGGRGAAEEDRHHRAGGRDLGELRLLTVGSQLARGWAGGRTGRAAHGPGGARLVHGHPR